MTKNNYSVKSSKSCTVFWAPKYKEKGSIRIEVWELKAPRSLRCESRVRRERKACQRNWLRKRPCKRIVCRYPLVTIMKWNGMSKLAKRVFDYNKKRYGR